MKFCNECAAPLTVRIPPGDNVPRYVCTVCATVHYQNPKIVAGCVAEWQGRILLCRRAIEPRSGLWTLPAGFMENEESAVQAARRETWEEANAQVEDLQLCGLYSLLHVSQVYLMFRGQLKDGQASAGVESLEVGLFTEAEIPWSEIAFAVVEETLRQYFADRRNGVFQMHVADIIRSADALHIHRYT